MTRLLRCDRGHEWQAGDDGPPPPCPVCQPVTTVPADPHQTQTHAPSTHNTASGAAIPGYEVLGELGRGGMGVVYKARHIQLNRIVALKMILSADAGDEELERFATEARAVARLRHPNIVQIYEVGDHAGRPYFALEYVEGGSLASRLDGTPLPPRDAADLVQSLASAMQAAHEAGIVHRDLKPGNILLSVVRGPSSVVSGEGPNAGTRIQRAMDNGQRTTPKITDFGLAKHLDEDSARTRSGAIMGTPSYMAPEQAEGRIRDIGPATDVYALGAILYQLLTGRPPFQAASVLDVLEMVRSRDPVAPRRLQPGVHRDLETICLKCLHKDPAKRYASARELALDLDRYLNGRPILARPTGVVDRALKAAKRRPGVALLGAGIVLLLLVSFVTVTALLLVADREKREAIEAREQARISAENAARERQEADRENARAREQLRQREEASRRAESSLHATNIATAFRAWAEERPIRAEEMLDATPSPYRRWEWYHLKGRLQAELDVFAGFDALAISPDGNFLATLSREGLPHLRTYEYVRLWDLRSHQPLPSIPLPFDASFRNHSRIAFSPDGKRLAVSGKEVGVWDIRSRKRVVSVAGPVVDLSPLAFSPDGKLLAAANVNGDVRVWDAETGKLTTTLTGHTNTIQALAFSPDSSRLASAGNDNSVRVWDVAAGKAACVCSGHTNTIDDVAFTPDGARVISTALDRTTRVWDARTGALVRPIGDSSSKNCQTLALSPDGKTLALGELSGVIVLHDLATGERRKRILAHNRELIAVAFHPDGKRLFSLGRDEVIKVWDVAGEQDHRWLATGHRAAVTALAFAPHGTHLASGSIDGIALMRDSATGATVHSLPKHPAAVTAVAYRSDGKVLLTACADGAVRLWNTATGAEVKTLTPARPGGLDAGGASALFLPDGGIASGHGDGFLVVRGPDGEKVREVQAHTQPVTGLAMSGDGALLATAVGSARGWGTAGEVKVWDARTGELLQTLAAYGGGQAVLAFHPDGAWLAALGDHPTRGGLRIWEARTGREVFSAPRPIATGSGLAFTPDGNRLLISTWNGNLEVWDLTPLRAPNLKLPMAQAPLVVFDTHDEYGTLAVAVSPDGHRVATSGNRTGVRVWTALPGPVSTALGLHEDEISAVAFSPSGNLLALGVGTFRIRLIDSVTQLEAGTLPGFVGEVDRIRFQPGRSRLTAATRHNTVKVFDLAADRAVSEMPGGLEEDARRRGMDLSPDGRRLAHGDPDGGLHLTDLDTMRETAMIPLEQGPLEALAYHPDGRQLAVLSVEGAVSLWDLVPGVKPDGPLWRVTPSPRVTALAHSPDGVRLALVDREKTVRICDTKTGKEVMALPMPYPPWEAAFRPAAEGKPARYLAVCLSDCTVRVWDLAERREVSVLRTPGEPHGLAFSPDGTQLAVVAGNHSVRWWRWPTEDVASLGQPLAWQAQRRGN